jgi:ketosteroid isomerase-like protein
LNGIDKNSISTKATIQSYFNALKQKKGWESFMSVDMIFTSPNTKLKGKDAYIESTKLFFQMVKSIEVKELLIDGEKACALTRYDLQSPKGNTLSCDVAEIFTVKNGEIDSFTIYFDTAPFSAFNSQG